MCQPFQPSCTQPQGCPAQAGGDSRALHHSWGNSPPPPPLLLYHFCINFFTDLQCLSFWGPSPGAGTSAPAHRGRRRSPPSPAQGPVTGNSPWHCWGWWCWLIRAVTAPVRVWHTWTCHKSRGGLGKHSSNQYLDMSYQIIPFPVLGRREECVLQSSFS